MAVIAVDISQISKEKSRATLLKKTSLENCGLGINSNLFLIATNSADNFNLIITR